MSKHGLRLRLEKSNCSLLFFTLIYKYCRKNEFCVEISIDITLVALTKCYTLMSLIANSKYKV
jgi:hypothetical protein